MYSCGPLPMDEQRQDVQLEPTYCSCMPIQDVALRICRKQCPIGRRGERGSGISVLIAWHDDDDNDDVIQPMLILLHPFVCMGADNFLFGIFLVKSEILYPQTILAETNTFSKWKMMIHIEISVISAIIEGEAGCSFFYANALESLSSSCYSLMLCRLDSLALVWQQVLEEKKQL